MLLLFLVADLFCPVEHSSGFFLFFKKYIFLSYCLPACPSNLGISSWKLKRNVATQVVKAYSDGFLPKLKKVSENYLGF